MQVWLKWRNLPSKILLYILLEIEVICKADGEGEGNLDPKAMSVFKSGGKGTQLSEVDTRGGRGGWGKSLGMTPGIFGKKLPLLLKGGIQGSAGLVGLETPGPRSLPPDCP